jgi:hypothetical protein
MSAAAKQSATAASPKARGRHHLIALIATGIATGMPTYAWNYRLAVFGAP